MAAITRWISFPADAGGEVTDGNGSAYKGTLGVCRATASVGDTFTIGPTSNRLYVSLDGDTGPYITMYSGTNLDPRFVAKDITEKMHDLKVGDRWGASKCLWTNDKAEGNCFEIYSGTLGSSSSVVVTTGESNDASAILGFATLLNPGGLADANGFSGDITVTGDYLGFLDETYTIVITNDSYSEAGVAPRGIGTPTKDGSNSYDGSMVTGGAFNGPTDLTYTINVDVTNGSTMGGGNGNVPRISWVSTGSDSSTVSTELLFPGYWYKVGDYGLMVKFTDAVFNQVSPAWTIGCKKPDYVGGSNPSGPVGTAEYVWASDRGEMSSSPFLTSSGVATQLGTRGLSVVFNPVGSDDFNAGDEFRVICTAPKPNGYNITSLNYGNVTVSTESSVKCVVFEIEAGAVEMSTVKFGLQSHGTFSHHDAGNNDTEFRFGTVGPDNTAGTGATNGTEWWPNVVPGDIDDNTAPVYLYNTKANLLVVSTADDSESIGNTGLMSDPIFTGIRLGSSETGANSTVNLRLYFDYS